MASQLFVDPSEKITCSFLGSPINFMKQLFSYSELSAMQKQMYLNRVLKVGRSWDSDVSKRTD